MSVDLSKYTKANIGKLFDHSVLQKNALEREIREGGKIAVKYDCATFYCPTAYWIDVAKEELAGSDVLLGCGVDFPWGMNDIYMKTLEAEHLVKSGVQAIDISVNVCAVREHRYDYLLKELQSFKKAAEGAITKAILEVCFLTDEEIDAAAKVTAEADINYVKTSTGQFDGPSMEQFLVMKKAVAGSDTKLKVAGVKFPRPQNAYAFIMAGAELIGTRATPAIIESLDTMREIGFVPAYKA